MEKEPKKPGSHSEKRVVRSIEEFEQIFLPRLREQKVRQGRPRDFSLFGEHLAKEFFRQLGAKLAKKRRAST